MTYSPVGSGDVAALPLDSGDPLVPDENGFVTLGAGTFVFPVNGSDPGLLSVEIITDTAIAGVFTFENTTVPAFKNGAGSGTPDLPDNSSNVAWVEEDPPDGHVSTTSGAGWTVVGMELTKAAGTAGAAVIHLGNFGARRGRIKGVISTGGKARVNRFGKKNT